MCHLDPGLKRLTGSEDALFQPRQRYGLSTEAAKLRGSHVRLGVPERIEHSDQGRALPGEIVEVEQLESAETWRAEGRFNFLLVAQCLQLAGCHQEIAGLITHVVFSERVAKDLEVLRFQHASVFGDFVEIRIHAPLANLMRDDRHVEPVDVIPIISVRLRRAGR